MVHLKKTNSLSYLWDLDVWWLNNFGTENNKKAFL